MARINWTGLALAGMISFSSASVLAIEWWHDPERGCGTLDGWIKSSRIKDLPGCDGELPKGAPPGEISMRDAKRALHDAEKILDGEKTEGVEAKLELATTTMNKAPNDPRVNWARPHYKKALDVLRAKLQIVPRLAKLRAAFKAAADASAEANKLKTDSKKKAALAAADACVQAFREAEAQGADLSIPVELSAGKPRPLKDDLRECASGKTTTEQLATTPDQAAEQKPVDPGTGGGAAASGGGDKGQARAGGGGSDGGVPRDKWVKKLRGDRKKVFMDHPDAFPEFDGPPGPRGAGKAPEWRYGSEVFKFKGSKLLKPKK